MDGKLFIVCAKDEDTEYKEWTKVAQKSFSILPYYHKKRYCLHRLYMNSYSLSMSWIWEHCEFSTSASSELMNHSSSLFRHFITRRWKQTILILYLGSKSSFAVMKKSRHIVISRHCPQASDHYEEHNKHSRRNSSWLWLPPGPVFIQLFGGV